MTDIVARVEDVKREPRPTLYMNIVPWSGDKKPGWTAIGGPRPEEKIKLPGAIQVVIPGTIELARAAAIEKARDAVITAATYASDCVSDVGLKYSEFDRLREALVVLKSAEKETRNG